MTSRPSLASLPQELLDLIVDLLSDSRQALACLRLASRLFYGRSRLHIYRSLTITTPRRSFAAFVEDLAGTHGDIRPHVQHLTLSRYGTRDGEDGKPPEPVTAGLVKALLELLPHLRRLTFSFVTLAPEPDRALWERPLPHFELAALSFLQVETAQLWGCEAYLEILSLFHAIDTLTSTDRFAWPWPAPGELDPELLPAPCFPRALAVRHLHMGDVRASHWLALLSHTRTLAAGAPALAALDVALVPHAARAPSAEASAALGTAGAHLASLRVRLWPDFHAAHAPYAHAAQLPAVGRWCPRLATFAVRVPLWCSLRYILGVVECVATLLFGLPPTVRTFALELDLEGHPWPVVERARECMPRYLWEMLKFAIEGAGVTRVDLVWLHLRLAAGEDVRLRQELSETDTMILAGLESHLYTVQSTFEAY
ncbi:hypothetical protein PsYK624_065960 [Phanerochaete sordida]|uniref:Uncharacterized protein n=1 Tax=Phanerochaete sordida TaxID=48140 RepID=A0A9P3LCQ1_9APHY|nr:hypothetical protein PsYK624_065960 [Phanerochaete sordida]